MQRTASGMHAEGNPFQGILFAGLMLKDGKVDPIPFPCIMSLSLQPEADIFSSICPLLCQGAQAMP